MKVFHPDVDAMIAKGRISVCYGLKIDFRVPLAITDCGHDLNANNDYYISHPRLVGLEAFTKRAELEVSETSLSFNTGDQYINAVVLGDDYRNTPVWLRRFYLDDKNECIEVETVWTGRIVSYSDSDKNNVMNLKIKNAFANFEYINSWRTTPASHKRRYPNDECMRYAARASETIYWGGEPAGGDD